MGPENLYFGLAFTDTLIKSLDKEILDLNVELSALKRTLLQLDGTGVRQAFIYE